MKAEGNDKKQNKRICNFFSFLFQPSSFSLPPSGFTLLEVIVAITVLSICLVLVMQLFSGGLRASRTSCDYTRAVVHAKDKIEELETSSDAPVPESGEFEDGFKWDTEVEPYKEFEKEKMSLMQIRVRVLWDDVLKKPRS
ncbi:MAG: type II secretion system protein, partial [Nitrospirae bacterium]|nr:type II secretion system protein [Nitrospirota bacterium]